MTSCISNSPWAQYVSERENSEVFETSEGFAIYTIEQNTVYLKDIWVAPEHRKSYVASRIADTVALIAKERGCNQMLGSVCPTAKNSHQSLQVLLAYGMILLSSQNNIIFLSKVI